jgi:hypothetical protein
MVHNSTLAWLWWCCTRASWSGRFFKLLLDSLIGFGMLWARHTAAVTEPLKGIPASLWRDWSAQTLLHPLGHGSRHSTSRHQLEGPAGLPPVPPEARAKAAGDSHQSHGDDPASRFPPVHSSALSPCEPIWPCSQLAQRSLVAFCPPQPSTADGSRVRSTASFACRYRSCNSSAVKSVWILTRFPMPPSIHHLDGFHMSGSGS